MLNMCQFRPDNQFDINDCLFFINIFITRQIINNRIDYIICKYLN